MCGMARNSPTCAVPCAPLIGAIYSTSPYIHRGAVRASPFTFIVTLHTATLIFRPTLYSGWSRKYFVETLLQASFAASSSEGIRSSQVSMLRRQKDQHGIPAVLRSSPNVLIPASLLVLDSVIMKDRVSGSTSLTSSNVLSLTLSLREGAYLPTFSSYSSDVLLLTVS